MASKFRYNSKTFLITLLSLTTVFVGLVLLNGELTKRTSTSTKAETPSGPSCEVTVSQSQQDNPGFISKSLNKINIGPNEGDSYYYIAVAKGANITFRGSCSSFSSTPSQQWNFGENCNLWENPAPSNSFGSAVYQYSKISHTFNKNGDYLVTLLVKENGKEITSKVQIGVYDSKTFTGPAYTFELTAPSSTSKIVNVKIPNSTNPTQTENAVLAWYNERICRFDGSGASLLNTAYKKVQLGSETSPIYSSKSTSQIDKRVSRWDDQMCQTRFFFWDFPDELSTRGKVTSILYNIKAPTKGTAHLKVDGYSAVYRSKADYNVKPVLCPSPVN